MTTLTQMCEKSGPESPLGEPTRAPGTAFAITSNCSRRMYQCPSCWTAGVNRRVSVVRTMHSAPDSQDRQGECRCVSMTRETR